MGIKINDIAPPSLGNYWKPVVGDTLAGEITYLAMQAPRVNFERVQQELRIDLRTADGEEITWYVTVNGDVNGNGLPKRDARAVATAVRAAGGDELEVGGRLAAQRIADAKTDKGMAWDFTCVYQPPTVGVSVAALAGPGPIQTTQAAPAPMVNPFQGLDGGPVPQANPTQSLAQPAAAPLAQQAPVPAEDPAAALAKLLG